MLAATGQLQAMTISARERTMTADRVPIVQARSRVVASTDRPSNAAAGIEYTTSCPRAINP
jgi:hypothetical protein